MGYGTNTRFVLGVSLCAEVTPVAIALISCVD